MSLQKLKAKYCLSFTSIRLIVKTADRWACKTIVESGLDKKLSNSLYKSGAGISIENLTPKRIHDAPKKRQSVYKIRSDRKKPIKAKRSRIPPSSAVYANKWPVFSLN